MATGNVFWRQAPWLTAMLLSMATATRGEDRKPEPQAALARTEAQAVEQVAEVVRAQRPGVLLEVLVKPGDTVRKDQVLGHTELDTAKLNVDLARANLESTGTLDQMYWQYQALIVTRQETELAVRKRTMQKSRLEFAKSMENWAQGQYQAQQDIKKVQKINFEHCQKEYEARFFHSPIDGIVTEVKGTVGQAVAIGAPVFTISPGSRLTAPVVAAASAAKPTKKPTPQVE